MKKVTILGSTGSIGINTLDIIEKNPDKFKVTGLTAGSNVKELANQITRFKPSFVAVRTKKDANHLKSLPGISNTRILYDETGIEEVASHSSSDIVLSAISGAAGLKPTLAAIEAGKDIALANKETLVAAGSIVMRKSREKKVKILPVDSEHSAIFQCLAGQKRSHLRRVILTASGGPFYRCTAKELKNVTVNQALRHPRWKMGKKITIDSASLMNKGLEVIEAKWLFDLDISHIDVLIHPQSVVHSLIELIDGSVLAQLGIADMRIPIAYALTYPDRMQNDLAIMDLTATGRLDFYPPDMKKFPCLGLAYQAGRTGGTATAAMNAANEMAVGAFLEQKIRYMEIPLVVEKVMCHHVVVNSPSLDDVIEADQEARQKAKQVIIKMKKG